ncbi:CBS domain-containing protein [Shimia thalassica]|uniref:Arabinose 5-phosphate isomerase KdsD n=1 Tax=Shimia thalassica TaxID=1715693 RepID=A0A0P1IGI1_9RHOB|nr:CBS domain-containing protein [Shimia thalassica]PHO05290.1 CBS domain-containing protein [Rhodobacteraceae bacterium 4F10]MBU2942535.1 CBS domain-containing protein [Shimia thalassica]MDO6481101.1 CBS domain-containing protein [Shimia thalassica]MDO6485562.1 CBS domain-containing protein [Shimia thalassica]MDO6504466.1 CBS domain-containing protein [Shimia thalassica]
MAPSSYQSPSQGDKSEKTYSQTSQSNLASSTTTISKLLDEKGNDVITVRPNDTISTVVTILRDKGIGAVVVTDQNRAVLGILSERDIVRRMADTPGQTLPQAVEDLMTKDVLTCAPADSMIDVLKRMTEGKFRHMPVMDGTSLVGMITVGDVVNFRLTELEYEALKMKQMIVG